MQIYVGYIVNSIRADYANSSLDELLCLYSLGKIHAYQLPDLSELLIDKGIESQYLVDLLISDDLNADEKTIIFQRAMNDVGYEIPDQRSAALRLSKNIAEKILSGDVSAYDGAYTIWKDILDYVDPIPDELWSFKSNASAIEDEYSFNQDYEFGRNSLDHTKLIESCISEILASAKKLCDD